MLKSKRSIFIQDVLLREAINLALEEDRKDTEKREAIRSSTTKSDSEGKSGRRHQQAMERETREHHLAMQAAVKEQIDIAREKNRLAQEQMLADKQNKFTADDYSRCSHCKKRFKYSRNIHNGGAFIAER